MGEPKPLASLSSSLLARKGHAKPAMRPQGFANFGFGGTNAQDDLGWNDMGHDHVTRDHGLGAAIEPISAKIVPIVPASAPEIVAQPAEPPAVVRQQEELARELAPAPVEPVAAAPVSTNVSAAVAPEPAAPTAPAYVAPIASTPRAAAGSKGKAAFTLRLDPDRHLRLRLVCAVSHKSAQAIVISALDAFLAAQPATAALVEAANGSGKGTIA